MRKALLIWSPLTRSNSEISITPRSQANSTSRSDAMSRKFWSIAACMMPMMMAKVMVVVASTMLLRFFLNSSVLNRLGISQRKNTRLSSEAMMA